MAGKGRFWLMDWLMDQGWLRDWPRGQILVLLSFARHANTKGISYPSVRTTAKETGLSDRTVQRWTRKLVSIGLLFQMGSNTGGSANNPKSTTWYRLFAQTYADFKQTTGDNVMSPVPPSEEPVDNSRKDELRGDKQGGGGVTKRAVRGDISLSPKGTIKELEGIAQAVGQTVKNDKTAQQQIEELHSNRHLFGKATT